MQPYHPIDCGFHDVLEATITRRQPAQLSYLDEQGTQQVVTTTLTDLTTRRVENNLEEYLVLDTKEEVRLDRIIRLNNIVAPVPAAGSSCNTMAIRG